MAQNNFGLHIHIQPLPGLDMMSGPAVGHPMRPRAIGLKGPWNINPGNPNFPNHRPYMTSLKPANPVASVPSQKLKTT